MDMPRSQVTPASRACKRRLRVNNKGWLLVSKCNSLFFHCLLVDEPMKTDDRVNCRTEANHTHTHISPYCLKTGGEGGLGTRLHIL